MKKLLLILLMTMCVTNVVSAESQNYVVTASGLNIRQEPNTNCSVLAVAKYGTILSGENTVNGWTPIYWNGNKAFVFSIYLKEIISTPNKYTQEDLNLLSRVIFAEAGSDWLSDEHQRAVASVVLNRVNDSKFPNTIRDVVYQKGQYGCVYNGMINRTPNQRAIDNARYVLENGITIPDNVVWQSTGKQGKGVWKYIEGHYFCY